MGKNGGLQGEATKRIILNLLRHPNPYLNCTSISCDCVKSKRAAG